jgi:chromosome segregation ATPase
MIYLELHAREFVISHPPNFIICWVDAVFFGGFHLKNSDGLATPGAPMDPSDVAQIQQQYKSSSAEMAKMQQLHKANTAEVAQIQQQYKSSSAEMAKMQQVQKANAAEVAQIQQQHKAIMLENKNILRELQALQASVTADKTAESVKRLDAQLAKLSSAHDQLAGKQGTLTANHEKIVQQVTELRKELTKTIESSDGPSKKQGTADSAAATDLSKRIEALSKQVEKISTGSLAVAATEKSSVDLDAVKKGVVDEAVQMAIKALGDRKVDTDKLKKELRDEIKASLMKEVLAEVEASLEKKVQDKMPSITASAQQAAAAHIKAAQANAAPNAAGAKQQPAATSIAGTKAPVPNAAATGSWTASSGSASAVTSGSSANVEEAVRQVLRKMYEERVGSVDWTLAINNASIVSHSSIFNNCDGI